MSHADRELLTALAAMCAQYLENDGVLDHQCMSAGEKAVRVLIQHGLVTPSARGGAWTDAGRAVLRDA
ncbi:hypothetical protein DBR41_23270 [Pseudomonas sp. HMWF010]|nr:hypothetical protein DBR21_02485 [Caulobacter sp. HMWF009]PTT09876.1 hypothetical protein DBR10_06605 [Caulobacter sp. HMWF025]PTT78432.1 hypothetical protein DBR41_23270 [Pseudomonas sp. HMWF010]